MARYTMLTEPRRHERRCNNDEPERIGRKHMDRQTSFTYEELLACGRGEMFGQLSLLSRQTRRTQITAITHSTLLVLDETRFRRLLERSETLRAAVRESAEKRGLPVDLLGL